jgi:pectinesterase
MTLSLSFVAVAVAVAGAALLHGALADVTLIVRSDGTGQFTSVQAALDSCNPGSNSSLGHVTLMLEGYFRERVTVYSNFTDGVAFVGTGAVPTDATIAFNEAGVNVTTWNSSTVTVWADAFVASNVAFVNDAGGYNKTLAGQSVALMLYGDRNIVANCSLLGAQDTLYTGTGRLWAIGSQINGSCDSIFGEGSAVFQACEVIIFDTVTAHKGNGSTAYLFQDCTIAPTVGGSYLGRPWGPQAHVVLKNCYLGANVTPAGWEEWDGSPWVNETFYAEFQSSGPGANPAARVPWSFQLNATAAAQWTPQTVLGGWVPSDDLERALQRAGL